MRIDEMRGFFSRIAPGSAAVKGNAASSVLHVPLQQQQNDDSLMLSKTGKLLGLHVKKSPSLTGDQKTETDKLQKLPLWAQKADKALEKTINIFEQMQKVAERAQDETITDLERVDMQIEMEGLRANLLAMPNNLRSISQGGASVERLPLWQSNLLLDMSIQGMERGYYSYGDYSSVMGRMKTRIANGEEWDVREAFALEGFTRVTYDENGEEVVQALAGEAWHVVGDENILTFTSDCKVKDSGINVPTVREELERKCPVIVMDAESAANGAKYLENQIASVQQWREHLSTNFKDLVIEDAYNFLHRLVFPDLTSNAELLTDPTVTDTFLFSEGPGDLAYSLNRSSSLEYLEDADISFNDKETIEDRRALTYNGEILRIPKLTKESLEANITIEELKQPKVIEIKGISQKRK